MRRYSVFLILILLLTCGCVFCWTVLFHSSTEIERTRLPWTQISLGRELVTFPDPPHETNGELDLRAPPTEAPRPSRFLYLLQTESCLPDYLGSVAVFGNASACNCDVLVLSYKQFCSVAPPSHHIEYRFNSSATWSLGRNQLFEFARRRGEKYLYYIFTDDDIILEASKGKNPWRILEDFLKRIEPAVAGIDTDTHPFLPAIYSARRKQGCILKEKAECLPAARFDEAVNAFHYQAVGHLLPYLSKFDAVSWWYPGVYMAVKCEILFQGHSVLHTELHAINLQHRSYPKKLAGGSDLLAILKEVENELPEKYRNSSLLLEWRKNGLKHETMSSTLCLPPPLPHMPIKPFYIANSF